jgi:hypothetical protein
MTEIDRAEYLARVKARLIAARNGAAPPRDVAVPAQDRPVEPSPVPDRADAAPAPVDASRPDVDDTRPIIERVLHEMIAELPDEAVGALYLFAGHLSRLAQGSR